MYRLSNLVYCYIRHADERQGNWRLCVFVERVALRMMG